MFRVHFKEESTARKILKCLELSLQNDLYRLKELHPVFCNRGTGFCVSFSFPMFQSSFKEYDRLLSFLTNSLKVSLGEKGYSYYQAMPRIDKQRFRENVAKRLFENVRFEPIIEVIPLAENTLSDFLDFNAEEHKVNGFVLAMSEQAFCEITRKAISEISRSRAFAEKLYLKSRDSLDQSTPSGITSSCYLTR